MWKNVWLYVLLGTTMMLLLGIVYSYSMFRLEIEPLYHLDAFQSGLPYMFSLFFYALFMAVGGRLLQQYPTIAVSSIGTVLIGGGFFVAALWPSLLGMIVAYGILIGSGVGLLYGLPLRIISQLTYSKTGLLTGITLMGFGLSPLIFAPLVQQLISHQGLDTTFLILGVLYTVLLSAIFIPLSKRDFTPKQTVSWSYDMLKDRSFYVVYALFFIGTLIGLTIIGFTGNIGVDVIGLTETEAAFYVALFAILNGIGRPLFGYLQDTIGFVISSAVSFVLLTVMATLFVLVTQNLFLYIIVFSTIYITFGGWLALAPGATRRLFGSDDYSKNYGIMFTAYGFGALLGSGFGGLVVDAYGYNSLFIMIIVLALIGLIIIAWQQQLLQEKKS